MMMVIMLPVCGASYPCPCSDFQDHADFCITEADDRTGYNILQDQVGHSEELASCCLGPVLKADKCLLSLIPDYLYI